MMEAQAREAFAAISEGTRLAMLRWLLRRGPDGATAGDVARAVGATPSRASHRLATRERAGLVASTRSARHVIHGAGLSSLRALAAFLLDRRWGGAGHLAARCAAPGGRAPDLTAALPRLRARTVRG